LRPAFAASTKIYVKKALRKLEFMLIHFSEGNKWINEKTWKFYLVVSKFPFT
jgi:hypothetical protein